MIAKLINQLIIVTILSSVNLIAYGEVMDLKSEYYEKDGCIYLIGNLTKEEKLKQGRIYKERMERRDGQIEAKQKARLQITIETIKAQAMRDYLIAQSMPLREVADAIKKIKFSLNVNIGNIISKSISNSAAEGGSLSNKITNSLSNKVTNTNKNANTFENKNTNKN